MDERIQRLAKDQAKYCSVFTNPNRILILWILGNQELSVGEIAATIGASLPNVSQQLRVMKEKNVLTSRRDGHTVYYRVAKNHFLDKCGLTQFHVNTD